MTGVTLQRGVRTEKGLAALDRREDQSPASTRRFLAVYLEKGDL